MEKHATAAPQITTADDLLKKLRAGVKESYEITMRGMTIPIRVLSVDEINAIRREAIKQASFNGGDDVDKNVNVQKTTLKLASTITAGQPILGDRLLGMLSVDEINYLYNEWIRVMDNVNPSMETISDSEFRAIVDALKKNTITSRDCSLHQLKAICTAYQDLIQRLEPQTSQADS